MLLDMGSVLKDSSIQVEYFNWWNFEGSLKVDRDTRSLSNLNLPGLKEETTICEVLFVEMAQVSGPCYMMF